MRPFGTKKFKPPAAPGCYVPEHLHGFIDIQFMLHVGDPGPSGLENQSLADIAKATMAFDEVNGFSGRAIWNNWAHGIASNALVEGWGPPKQMSLWTTRGFLIGTRDLAGAITYLSPGDTLNVSVRIEQLYV